MIRKIIVEREVSSPIWFHMINGRLKEVRREGKITHGIRTV
jgi:hypothetical protein